VNKSSYRTLLVCILSILLTTVCNLPRNYPAVPSSSETTTLTPTSTASTIPPTSTSTDYLIPPTTKVMNSELQEMIESISPEGIIIFSSSVPALESLAVGDVLVSDTIPAAPDGLLRKVSAVRVEGNRVIVETVDAELIEAVHEGQVAFVKELTPENIR